MTAPHPIPQHPALWRGRKHGNPTLEGHRSGFKPLDALLHAGGWPRSGSTELLSDYCGIGELSLLLPALAALSQQRRIGWLAPPWLPYAPALQAAGLAPERCLVVTTVAGAKDTKDQLWAAEQMLKSGGLAAVLTWFDQRQVSDGDLRRLQLAADQGHCWHIHFRPLCYRHHSSPARLRLLLESTDAALAVEVLKQPGGWSGQQCELERPPQLLWQQQPCWQWPGSRPLNPPVRRRRVLGIVKKDRTAIDATGATV